MPDRVALNPHQVAQLLAYCAEDFAGDSDLIISQVNWDTGNTQEVVDVIFRKTTAGILQISKNMKSFELAFGLTVDQLKSVLQGSHNRGLTFGRLTDRVEWRDFDCENGVLYLAHDNAARATGNGNIYNAMQFASRPGLSFFECFLSVVVSNAARRYYGPHPLAPTGPSAYYVTLERYRHDVCDYTTDVNRAGRQHAINVRFQHLSLPETDVERIIDRHTLQNVTIGDDHLHHAVHSSSTHYGKYWHLHQVYCDEHHSASSHDPCIRTDLVKDTNVWIPLLDFGIFVLWSPRFLVIKCVTMVVLVCGVYYILVEEIKDFNNEHFWVWDMMNLNAHTKPKTHFFGSDTCHVSEPKKYVLGLVRAFKFIHGELHIIKL